MYRLIELSRSADNADSELIWRPRVVSIKWLTLLVGIAMTMLGACNQARSTSDQPEIAKQLVDPGILKVQVRKTVQGYQLLRGNQPYFIRGGGGLEQTAQLHAAGGNSIRLWSTDYAGPLLNEAQQQGLTVMLGLWLEPESKTFSYYDPAMVQAQLRRLRAEVLRYRSHPALLMWNVSNEVDLSTSSPRLFEAMNGIARMIHEVDPYHPVTSSLANFSMHAAKLQSLAPEIDILSINIYGALRQLPALLVKSGWQGPYIITEYGGRGYWETNFTTWHAPIEQTGAAKARFMKDRYPLVIKSDSTRCLGSYVFYWGSKFEWTPTWFSLFEPNGEKTELVDELYLLWRKQYPVNRAPHLTGLLLAGKSAAGNVQLQASRKYLAVVSVTDPEADSLTTRWEMLPEMSPEADTKEIATPLEAVPGCVMRDGNRHALIRMPKEPGAYRLYVRVFDGHRNVATGNVPVLVR